MLIESNQTKQTKTIFLEITTSDPSIYIMDHPDFTVVNFMESYIGLKWFN